jgi:hypothetical protein
MHQDHAGPALTKAFLRTTQILLGGFTGNNLPKEQGCGKFGNYHGGGTKQLFLKMLLLFVFCFYGNKTEGN